MLEALGELGKRARALGEAEFERELGGPVLVFAPFAAADEAAFATFDKGQRSIAARGQELVALVRKRPGSNAFTNMITVGRATNNDIVVPHAAVSKLHAYFALDPGRPLALVDSGSRFGTFVDGARLEPRSERRPLADGARIRFGRVEATFRLPAGLRATLLGQAPA